MDAPVLLPMCEVQHAHGRLTCMRLRHPGDIDRVLRMLADLQNRLVNYRGHEDTVPYLAWCAEASRQMREHFVSIDLAGLAERDQRELTFGGAVMTRPLEFLDSNIDLWQVRLAGVRMALEKLRPFIERPGSLLVLDTSAFIEGEYFTEVDWHGLAGVQAGQASPAHRAGHRDRRARRPQARPAGQATAPAQCCTASGSYVTEPGWHRLS